MRVFRSRPHWNTLAWRMLLASSLLAALAGCGGQSSTREPPAPPEPPPPPPLSKADTDTGLRIDSPAAGPRREPAASRPTRAAMRSKIVAAARREVARKGGYDSSYRAIKYPGGDVPGGGVCTDLVLRALRGAGFDLQKLVHEDMKADFSKYPEDWDATRPDPNIDHRRVLNLMCFFRRKAGWLPRSVNGKSLAGWKPGDVVFWDLGRSGRKHCGVISDRKAPSGRPLVIHNLAGAAEEDCLARWKIIGHGRYPPGAAPAPDSDPDSDPDSEPAKG